MEKNKELTPMMELIELIELQQKNYIKLAKNDKTKRKEVDAILTATTLVKMKAKSLLPKEKQVNSDLEALKNQNRVLRNLNFKYREKLGLSNEPIDLDLLTELE